MFRAAELEDALTDEQPTLFDDSDDIRREHEAAAATQEQSMTHEWVSLIEANLRELLATRGQVHVSQDIVAILGPTLSLAGERHIRSAWDRLASAGDAQPRDKTRNLEQLTIRAA